MKVVIKKSLSQKDVLGIKKSSIYVVNVGLWFAHDCFAAVEVSTAGKRIDGLEEDCMETQATVNYADGRFQPIIDKCEGCGRIVENENTQYCRSYVNPAAKWKLGFCNFATHAKPEIEVVKIRVNPLKAAKRASKRK